MPQVLLQVDPGDGNELLEATVTLPVVPRVGDSIEVWDARSGFRNSPRTDGEQAEGFSWSGQSLYFDVKHVSFCTFAEDAITVVLSTDGHTDQDVRMGFAALARGDTP